MPAYPDTSAGMRAAQMGRRNGPQVVERAKHTHPAEGDGKALTHDHNNDDQGHTHDGYLPLGGPREAVDEPTEERAIEHEIDGEELDLWLHRLAWLGLTVWRVVRATIGSAAVTSRPAPRVSAIASEGIEPFC